jgi:HSP90 family molecular chaperone
MVGTILGTAAQVGGAIYGAVKSSEANKKAMDLIAKQRDENKKWYEAKMAEDYMQRADVQNVLRKQKELLADQYQRAKATNLVAGGTDESLALQQQAANAQMGETMSNIAAQASSAKDAAETAYRTQDAALTKQQIGVHQDEADAIAKAAGQVGEAASGLAKGLSATSKAGATEATDATGTTDVTKAAKVEEVNV